VAGAKGGVSWQNSGTVNLNLHQAREANLRFNFICKSANSGWIQEEGDLTGQQYQFHSHPILPCIGLVTAKGRREDEGKGFLPLSGANQVDRKGKHHSTLCEPIARPSPLQ
jgi:hypothetical protein